MFRKTHNALILGALLPLLLALDITPDLVNFLDGVGKPENESRYEHMTISPQSRIIGGKQALRDAYPFFSILIDTATDRFKCGGSLIHDDIVLSAAHCTKNYHPSVVVNAYSSARLYDGHIFRSVKKIITHPNYTSATEQNDFSLLILANPVDNITPVEMNKNPSSPLDGETLTAVGLGSLDGYKYPDYLQEVQVFAVNVNTCQRQLVALNELNFFRDTMLCAGLDVGGKDTCSGDSGGPLLTANGELVGLTSFGVGCAQPKSPGVYSRVSSANFWIRDNICKYSQNTPAYCGTGQYTSHVSLPLGPGEVKVEVRIQTDENPQEISYELRNRNTNATIFSKLTNFWTVGFELVLETTILSVGVPYVFVMRDSHGDGLCCSHGRGYIEIVAKLTDADVILSSLSGDRIGGVVNIYFTIPKPGTPTRRPTRTLTRQPSRSPTRRPSMPPTRRPNMLPTRRPSKPPTRRPSMRPSRVLSMLPTRRPSKRPTRRPSKSPTRRPSKPPTGRITTTHIRGPTTDDH